MSYAALKNIRQTNVTIQKKKKKNKKILKDPALSNDAAKKTGLLQQPLYNHSCKFLWTPPVLFILQKCSRNLSQSTS